VIETNAFLASAEYEGVTDDDHLLRRRGRASLLLDIYSKGPKANLSQAQRNTLRKILSALAAEWRANVRAKVKPLRRPK
jgi:hypothetical protein